MLMYAIISVNSSFFPSGPEFFHLPPDPPPIVKTYSTYTNNLIWDKVLSGLFGPVMQLKRSKWI